MKVRLWLSDGGPFIEAAPRDMPCVPRVGDTVEIDEETYGDVSRVTWLQSGDVIVRMSLRG